MAWLSEEEWSAWNLSEQRCNGRWIFCATETMLDKIPLNIATLVLLLIETPNIIKLAYLQENSLVQCYYFSTFPCILHKFSFLSEYFKKWSSELQLTFVSNALRNLLGEKQIDEIFYANRLAKYSWANPVCNQNLYFARSL